VRKWIVAAIPSELYASISAGIGLFLAFIGLRNAGIVVANPATAVSIGDLRSPNALLALLGLLLIAAFQAWKIRGAILAGMLVTTAVGFATGVAQWNPRIYDWSEISGTMLHLDIGAALRIGLLDIIFVFLFVDLFDNVGTLVAVSRKANLTGENHQIPGLHRILLCDASATIAGSLAGTTTVVSYVESAAGVAVGGRSGVTAIVVGMLFTVALFLAPLIGAIPAGATAPALIVVGGLMLTSVADIPWDEVAIGVPAFLTLVMIPLTFSIANGLAFGIVSHVLLRVAQGQGRKVPVGAYVLAALLMLRFIYIGAA
jgi:adenine/guanine/hypoxanthine permease